jgi:hypothetical protein
MLVAMTPIEVEVIDDTQSHGRGVDGARCSDGRVPVLKLHIPFNCQIMGQVVVQSDAGGVHHGVGLDVEGVAVDEPGGKVVDLAAADEEVGVGVEFSKGIFHFGAEEEVFLAADVAFVDGIGAARLKGGEEAAEEEEGQVGAGGDGEIFAALKVGKGAGGSGEGGELKALGSGRSGLRECGVGEGEYGGEQGELYRYFCVLHSVLRLLLLRVI